MMKTTTEHSQDEVIDLALKTSKETLDFILIVNENGVRSVLVCKDYVDINPDVIVEKVFWQGNLL